MLDILREYEYCIAYKRREDNKYRYIKPNRRFWYADPMPVQIDGRHYIFMESYDKYDMRGKIAVSEILGDMATPPTVVIDEPFHMSFPNVFKWRDEYYMIPETSEVNQIRIYKMGKRIYDWTLAGCISTDDKCLVDTAVISRGNDSLKLISGEIDSKDDHKCKTLLMSINSIVMGIEPNVLWEEEDYTYDGRNGGNIITRNGKLYRVIQHSDKTTYGKYVSVGQIVDCNNMLLDLDNTEIINLSSENIELNGFRFVPYGIHTYGEDDSYIVIDIGVRRLSIDGVFYKCHRRTRGTRQYT